MKNNLGESSYDWISNIDSLKFEDKSVLIVGGGEMTRHYAQALENMNIKDVTIITRTKKESGRFNDKFSYPIITGGFEKNLPVMKQKDLVIIATPIHTLISATKLAVQYGQTNILIEKPASLYRKELLSLSRILRGQRIRVAYNRLFYPSFHKLKQMIKEDGGISSCKFTFTEWIHKIPLGKYRLDEYQRWGISNSLHVISMAFELIGMPRKMSVYQAGGLDWHKTGSIFVGCGMTEMKIPFCYHADWKSAGRWGIEIMTQKNAYRLVPLEELYACKIDDVNWKLIPVKTAFPDVKAGIAEEISVMLDKKLEQKIGTVPLEKSALFNKAAEQIFGYNSINNL